MIIMQWNKIILTLIILSLTATPVLGDIPNPIDAGSTMIKDGINAFIIGVTDDILNSSIQLQTNTTTGDGGLIKVLAATHDPYKIEKINEMRATSRFLFFIFALLYIVWGCILAIWQTIQNKHNGLINLTHTNPTSHIYHYIGNLVKIFLILIFVDIVIICILYMNMVVSQTIVYVAITTVAPDASNVPAYFLLGIGMLFLMIFIAWRTIIISIVVAFAYILGMFFVVDGLQKYAYSLLGYFISIVFMQSIILGIATVGMIIMNTFEVDSGIQIIFYVAVILLLVVVAALITLRGLISPRSPEQIIKLVV